MASGKTSVLFLALIGSAAAALAQNPSNPTLAPGQDPATTPPVQTSAPTDTTPKRSRLTSDTVSSSLSAGFKYQPPNPKAEEEKDKIDLREVDKPRNGIVRLPSYIVEAQKPAIFADRNVYTRSGLAALARQRYFGNSFLNRWSLPLVGSVDSVALQMYADDERLNNMADANEKIYLYRQTGDNARANALQHDANSTYIRRDEYVEPLK